MNWLVGLKVLGAVVALLSVAQRPPRSRTEEVDIYEG
jgi:hypothetical protein